MHGIGYLHAANGQITKVEYCGDKLVREIDTSNDSATQGNVEEEKTLIVEETKERQQDDPSN